MKYSMKITLLEKNLTLSVVNRIWKEMRVEHREWIVSPAPLPTVLEEDSIDDPTPMDIDPQPAQPVTYEIVEEGSKRRCKKPEAYHLEAF